MIQISRIICPKCGHAETEKMPSDACQYFYDCRGCGAVIKPLIGDCCVYCSYGSIPCPPIQEARATGQDADCCGAGQVP
ncbi:MAG: GDCCVxC domain-containing (seleno)protein [Pseudomonadota bacterium]